VSVDPARTLARIERRNADALIKGALRRSAAGETSWDSLAHGLGRNDLPFLLMMLWKALQTGERIKGICDAWPLAEFPERYLSRDDWLRMFRAVGYLDEDKPAKPPERVTLWRGGVKRTRMAWTADRERAVWFQRRYSESHKPGKLWTVTVDSDRLLAHFHERHRHEDEFVIDPTGLRPRSVGGARG